MVKPAEFALRHYVAHWTAGVAQKVLPDEAINAEKSFIADAEKALAAINQQQAQEQQMQQQMQQQQGELMPPEAQGMPPEAQGMPPEMGNMPPQV